MTDLKKFKKTTIPLPDNFEQSVWKSIRQKRTSHLPSILTCLNNALDGLWAQPALALALTCVILICGAAIGQFNALASNGFKSVQTADLYVSSFTQTELL